MRKIAKWISKSWRKMRKEDNIVSNNSESENNEKISEKNERLKKKQVRFICSDLNMHTLDLISLWKTWAFFAAESPPPLKSYQRKSSLQCFQCRRSRLLLLWRSRSSLCASTAFCQTTQRLWCMENQAALSSKSYSRSEKGVFWTDRVSKRVSTLELQEMTFKLIYREWIFFKKNRVRELKGLANNQNWRKMELIFLLLSAKVL